MQLKIGRDMIKKEPILIVGSGGREHALGWKLKQSPKVGTIYFAPGNGGTANIGTNLPIKANDVLALTKFAIKQKIRLTIVGPEAPLVAGIVDYFRQKNLAIFGPTKKAAKLESSKSWALQFMKRHHLPHPEFKVFGDTKLAKKFIQDSQWSEFVIKADGLALGKGVLIANSKKEALQAIEEMTGFGEAGKTFIIQEKLQGYEVSVVAFTDGKIIVPLLPAQDHKRIFDGDRGPNTGGMGAYAPVPTVDKKLTTLIQKNILQPFLQGIIKDKLDYRGVIYPGLMITNDGPKVLEFNVRFGDPETQPQMMLLESDLIEIIEACIGGTLSPELVTFKKGSALCITLSAKGYPTSYKKGEEIHGLSVELNDNVQVFHAGTSREDGNIVTTGGRVLSVTATGKTLEEAHKAAYQAIGKDGIWFEGMEYRTDIASQALS